MRLAIRFGGCATPTDKSCSPSSCLEPGKAAPIFIGIAATPITRKVLVFDEDIYTGNHQLFCPECRTKIAAARVTIEDGKFVAADAVNSAEVSRDLGDSLGRAFAVIMADDGLRIPREDWFDHPVPYTYLRGARP